MVCTANDLLEWKEFPKGLRVLLLDEDSSSALELRSKLEEMDYIVSTFCNENEALSAISSKSERFHVAIVEVNTANSHGSFKFLETAKDLPTIMTSNIHCLNTMMKCIALGAVEFLRKPLCEDKLRNIWQHVVHKAFNAGGSAFSESNPVKESVISMLQLQVEKKEPKYESLIETDNLSQVHANNQEQSSGTDKYPAPSTPQLKQVGRLLGDGDCQDHPDCSTRKDAGEQDGESKSVETTSGNSVAEVTIPVSPPQILKDNVIKEEEDSAVGSKGEFKIPTPQNKITSSNFRGTAGNPSRASDIHNSCGSRANRKRTKVDWTADLHKKFLQAVEQLGADQAIPSRILELMKVEGLTRHNVASHLQKYRMHRRHILPKEDDQRWPPHQRDPMQRSYYPHKPVMAFPSYHSNHALQTGQVYPMWPNPAGAQMWAPPAYPTWQRTEPWLWPPTYPGMHADAWGTPVLPQPHGPCSSLPQNASGFAYAGAIDNSYGMPENYVDQPAEEVIDMVVKEAISKPWLPLPLGLKPPSTDSVLAELSRQGIPNIPPHFR